MPPEAAAPRPAPAGALAALPPHWRDPALRLGLAWLVLIAAFAADWRAMAAQWWDSSTYNHILLVPAIIAWLVWQRLPQLARLVPVAWWPGVIVFAGAAFLWLLGAFAGLNLARQAGAVGVLIGSALALLGPRVSAGLAFPLGYMVLLVPFGDELVPPLQMITAVITIFLVRLSGIPAVIDGVFIDTPAGLFEVAEACSGVKFLIAMLAFGLLVANVCFISWRRRALFLAFALTVPILANGLRAFGTILAAQYVGAEKAAGIDHLIYGWIFFGVVIALVIAASWKFFDRPAGDAMIDADAIAASPLLARLEATPARSLAVLAAMALALGAARGWAMAADRMEASVPAQIHLPQVRGWTRVDYAPPVWWEPRAEGAAHRLLGRYADEQGRTVDVFYALYTAQRDGMEAGGHGQGALTPDSPWSWQGPGVPAPDAKTDRLLAQGRFGRLAETYYRSGDLLTGSNARLKLAGMASRLTLDARPTAMLILSAEEPGGSAGQAAAAATLADFRRAAGPLDEWMDRVAGLR
jgi:exosortase A